MELCSGDSRWNHDEVCYDSKTCPVCEAIEEKMEAERSLVLIEKQCDRNYYAAKTLSDEIDAIKSDPIRLKALLEGLS